VANLIGSLSLSALDDRLEEAVRDSSLSPTMRAMYLQDAYSRIWYMYPWTFRQMTTTFTAASASADYVIDGQIDEVAAMLNETRSQAILMNRGMYMYFDSYQNDNHSGPLQTLVRYYEDGPSSHVVFQETPNGIGDGDTIQIFYCRHLIHNTSAGGTATGNMTSDGDVPSFAPQFHPLIVKEALMEAVKNRRDFAEMYELAKYERDEMLKSMKRRYLTPRRGGRLITIR
jgi:hypothetical protein